MCLSVCISGVHTAFLSAPVRLVLANFNGGERGAIKNEKYSGNVDKVAEESLDCPSISLIKVEIELFLLSKNYLVLYYMNHLLKFLYCASI
ncbi:hypothetical protein BpHYR1_000458 [Brachionus plicatilis]|uniref:Uncharacterized protein n=1 Tax=Brachionus plicatilis TaxID=10195 RepID=A0A3M7RML8_BRAPC|nr:hypothetical protein BpHYR1_000458 [Brachionus plicatilis]